MPKRRWSEQLSARMVIGQALPGFGDLHLGCLRRHRPPSAPAAVGTGTGQPAIGSSSAPLITRLCCPCTSTGTSPIKVTRCMSRL